MKVEDCGPDLDSEIDALQATWSHHDFLFLHFKDTDSRGEDGDFDGKVAAIEELDRAIPRLMELQPDVIVVTGDHSLRAGVGHWDRRERHAGRCGIRSCRHSSIHGIRLRRERSRRYPDPVRRLGKAGQCRRFFRPGRY